MVSKKTKTAAVFAALAIAAAVLSGCRSAPRNVAAVADFDAERYLGRWYEIARIDFRHERNMGNVTAEYSMNDDGSIRVRNLGFDYVKDKWKESVGRARFQGTPSVGALEVSFFGPFYSGYNVIALDANYQSALVAGKSHDYLWILSRTPALPEAKRAEFLATAESLGFDTERLVWVEHDPYR